VLSLMLSRFLSEWAQGSAHNALFFAGVTLILVVTSAFAATVPALRAPSVDSTEALRALRYE
jgi:ABC-type lipoprotein release transport system permease subunit